MTNQLRGQMGYNILTWWINNATVTVIFTVKPIATDSSDAASFSGCRTGTGKPIAIQEMRLRA
jgi:hypothetical protein